VRAARVYGRVEDIEVRRTADVVVVKEDLRDGESVGQL